MFKKIKMTLPLFRPSNDLINLIHSIGESVDPNGLPKWAAGLYVYDYTKQRGLVLPHYPHYFVCDILLASLLNHSTGDVIAYHNVLSLLSNHLLSLLKDS